MCGPALLHQMVAKIKSPAKTISRLIPNLSSASLQTIYLSIVSSFLQSSSLLGSLSFLFPPPPYPVGASQPFFLKKVFEKEGQSLTGSTATPLYANGQCATSHTFNNAPASCSGGGGGTDPTTTPTSTPTPTPPTCSWAGHCLGASCSTDNDCSDALVCKSGKCAN